VVAVLLGYDTGFPVFHYNTVTKCHIPEEKVPHPRGSEKLKTQLRCHTMSHIPSSHSHLKSEQSISFSWCFSILIMLIAKDARMFATESRQDALQ